VLMYFGFGRSSSNAEVKPIHPMGSSIDAEETLTDESEILNRTRLNDSPIAAVDLEETMTSRCNQHQPAMESVSTVQCDLLLHSSTHRMHEFRQHYFLG
jgi:hypothetical protein